MRIVLIAILVVHAIAHLVGFVVPWRLMTSADVPYRTTILAGAVDVGATGIKVVGVLWLAAALAFLVIALGLHGRASWWYPTVLPIVAASIALCVLGWPDARFGLVANVVIIALLLIATRMNLFPAP
jgi:hypothetical protein